MKVSTMKLQWVTKDQEKKDIARMKRAINRAKFMIKFCPSRYLTSSCLIPNFKTGWTLTRTVRVKPTGYIGYVFTLHGRDGVTVKRNVYAKTASRIWLKIINLLPMQTQKVV
jgi:hypothetical protein